MPFANREQEKRWKRKIEVVIIGVSGEEVWTFWLWPAVPTKNTKICYQKTSKNHQKPGEKIKEPQEPLYKGGYAIYEWTTSYEV